MRILVLLALVFFVRPALAGSPPLRVVAAENAYADIVRQIAGPGVDVRAILINPAQDPHLFEASPSIGRELTGAAIVLYNGAGYDPWMRPLLSATAGGGARRVIDVADLVHAGVGGNPHLWADPRTMPVVAKVVAHALEDADPGGAGGYRQRLARVLGSLARLDETVAALRARHKGAAVTATEPVFGLMVDALGLVDRDMGFQRAIMNDTEPSASQTAGMEDDLRQHRVAVLLRNSQTDDDTTRRLVSIARKAGVPVVDVTETEPAHMSYQHWMESELDALDKALGAGH
jgi:zinc/manganese transport system substrate-binding protein